MGVKALRLTNAEKKLLARLDVEAPRGTHGAGTAPYSGDAACALTKSLIRRHAIPEVRVQWFTSPDYNIGGHGKSRQRIFERNGVRREGIFRDPNFVRYLRYFIYGPDLPVSVVQSFEAEVARCGRVSPRDVIPLGKYARQQARDLDLDPSVAAEEFFKLALECELDVSEAGSIRSAVKQLRTRG